MCMTPTALATMKRRSNMKKIVFLLFTALVLTSCYDAQDKIRLQSECAALVTRKSELTRSVEVARNEVANLYKEKNALENGKEPAYIVKFEIKQGTFTLDLLEHAKNEMNAIEIEMPVKKEYYDRLYIGQDITDSFKWGSLIVNGDFSTLHMRVIGKRVE